MRLNGSIDMSAPSTPKPATGRPTRPLVPALNVIQYPFGRINGEN